MKKVWLHIGTHKTGTTTLQKFFFENKEVLLQRGLYYPTEGSYFYQEGENHSLLAHALRNERPEFLPDNLTFTLEGCVNDIRADIRKSDAPEIVISSEHFSFNSTTEQVERLKRVFDSIASEIHVIIYLRRQDHRIESGYGQMIKRGYRIGSFESFIQWMSSAPDQSLDYEKKVKLFADVFGAENVTVRIFEKSQIHPQGLLSDFMNILGISKLTEFKQVQDANISPSTEVLEILRYVNSFYPKVNSRKLFAQLFENLPLDGLDQTRYSLYSEALREKTLDNYRTSNERLARNFLNRQDGRLFHENEKSNAPIYPGLTGKALTWALSQIILQQANRS